MTSLPAINASLCFAWDATASEHLRRHVQLATDTWQSHWASLAPFFFILFPSLFRTTTSHRRGGLRSRMDNEATYTEVMQGDTHILLYDIPNNHTPQTLCSQLATKHRRSADLDLQVHARRQWTEPTCRPQSTLDPGCPRPSVPPDNVRCGLRQRQCLACWFLVPGSFTGCSKPPGRGSGP